jgi:hypothetical protein
MTLSAAGGRPLAPFRLGEQAMNNTFFKESAWHM